MKQFKHVPYKCIAKDAFHAPVKRIILEAIEEFKGNGDSIQLPSEHTVGSYYMALRRLKSKMKALEFKIKWVGKHDAYLIKIEDETV